MDVPFMVATQGKYDNTKAKDEAAQVTDNDRQSTDPTKLLNDNRLPYIYTQGKQDEADYKMAPDPPLPGDVVTEHAKLRPGQQPSMNGDDGVAPLVGRQVSPAEQAKR